MFPLVYGDLITEGTVPTSNGWGYLTDAISCEVTEERNGAYELTLVYPVGGAHENRLFVNGCIMAKPNFTDDPQLFRIYKVGKVLNGQIKYNAQHISYDLSGKVIGSGSAASCVAACSLLDASAGNFTINTDKNTNATFTITEPSSVRSWFGGKAGSLLDVFGSGEWYYNNFVCSLKASRGQDRGVPIRYGKNLTELSQEIDLSNLATAIIPFYVDQEGNKTIGAPVSTGLTLQPTRERAVDFSDSVDPESATPIVTQLSNLATSYVNNNDFVNIQNSITLSFVQTQELKERVDLCDTVHIFYEALGIEAAAKCIATTWDVLEERYTSTTFGNARTNIADTIATQQKEIKEAPSKSFMNEAIKHATDLITGNLGGYVILHDTNGDDEPDEILIMNTDDIDTATKVWRWNSGGLGYSSTGYAGPYGLAMTADGEIVADFISTGTLNANLIKSGSIEDTSQNSSIDMTTGVAKLKNLIAKQSLTLVDENNIKRAALAYTVIDGSTIRVYDANGVVKADMECAPNGQGIIAALSAAGHQIGTISSNAYGGGLTLKNDSDNIIAQLESDSTGIFLTMHNPNDVETCRLSSQSAGGRLLLNMADGSNAVTISSLLGLGGTVSVKNSSGATRATLHAKSGDNAELGLFNVNGQVISLKSDNGGSLAILNSTYKVAEISKGNDGGALYLRSNSGVNGLSSYVDNQGAGQLILSNSGSISALFDGETGSISLGIGSTRIQLQGDTGEAICVHLTQTSSRKVKKNIEPIKDSEKILELEAVKFDYKDEKTGLDQRGFIAEDVKEILPNLVKDEREDIPATLDYIQMIPYLQDVIKKQGKRIKALEDLINGTN